MSLISYLPLRVRTLVKSVWPTGFLPSTVIVKKLKLCWEEEFDNEKAMYRRLEALQGLRIPICYGEARCEGTRALVFSEVSGALSCEQQPPYLERKEFRREVEDAVQELGRFGVVLEDKKLHNVILADGKAMLVDLESAWEAEDQDELEWAKDIAMTGQDL